MRLPGASRHSRRPRAAAGVILLRKGSGHREVLLGRRAAGLRFMPGFYVSPGGCLEPFDREESGFPEALPAEHLPGVDAETRRLFPALRRAALRETWEETGLLLGARRLQGPSPEEALAPVWCAYHTAGIVPAFGSLLLIARAITPANSPVRFHSRFFLGCASELVIRGQLRGDGELEDLDWYPLDALEHLPLADVTRAVIAEAQSRLQDPRRRPPPLFCYQRGLLRRR